MTPAIALPMAEPDPSDTRTPTKMETPRNAGESPPGRYGKATTRPKRMSTKRTNRYVGEAHSRWKPLTANAPDATARAIAFAILITEYVKATTTNSTNRFGRYATRFAPEACNTSIALSRAIVESPAVCGNRPRAYETETRLMRPPTDMNRSEERRVGKECRYRRST